MSRARKRSSEAEADAEAIKEAINTAARQRLLEQGGLAELQDE
jgi:hypothetical protein